MTRAADAHVRALEAPPTGVWSAPGRVNLIGEHTDYHGGLVLPIALPQRTTAACAARDDDRLRVHSVQAGETVEVDLADVGPGRPSGWAAYVAGVLWALREDGFAVRGLDVTVDSEVPLGAGLSSSAALECAVGAAASDLFGLGLLEDDASRARLARACIRAENDIAGAMTGGMDQSASLLCREGHALLLDCRSGETSHVPFDLAGHHAPGGAGTGGHVLVVTDTRAAHALNDGQYEARRRVSEAAAAALGLVSLRDVDPHHLDDALSRLDDEQARRTRHVVTEIARVRAAVEALEAGDLRAVGRLFDASHASLRDDYEVSCDELDVSVEAARSAGALGARMTGGGFGGSSIALVPARSAEDVVAAVAEAFAERGWTPPRSFTVTAGRAAARDS
ncbi:galactokinase [Oryzobacter sp. R7]|uniref:galactokinase n=1 Tax=Oryzobacter faecalis TaxID=3388656 RepID=UPI00398CB8E6